MTPTPAVLRKELTASLKQADMTRTACAREAGVDGTNFSKFMKGDRPGISEATLIKIACVLPDDSPIGKRYAEEVSARRAQNPAPATNAAPGDMVLQLLHKDIHPDPENYRQTFDGIEELGEQIAREGLIQPLTIRYVKGKATIIDGERRYRAIDAAIKNKLWATDRPVPCLEKKLDDKDARFTQLIANLQRADVPRVEEARGVRKLRDEHKLSTKEIAERLGMKPRYVEQSLNLVEKLSKPALKLLEQNKINFDEARKLWTVPPKQQAEVMKQYDRLGEDMERAIEQTLGDFPPITDALFDVNLYAGETAGSGKDKRATDLKLFEKLQKEALVTLVTKLEATWSEVRQGTGYFDTFDYSKTKDKKKGFAYVQVQPPGQRNPWTTVTVHEGYFSEEAKKPKGKATNGSDKRSLTSQQRINASNLKTIVLQEGIGKPRDPYIPMGIMTQRLIEALFHTGKRTDTTLVRVEPRDRSAQSFTNTPAAKLILQHLEPIMAEGHFTLPERGDYLNPKNYPNPSAFLDALINLDSLPALFAACVSATCGSWPDSFSPTCGEDDETAHIANLVKADLQGTWKMKEDYLKGHKIAALKQIAIACGIADPNMPPQKDDAIAWILNHPDRDQDWLAPELKFGYRADITKDVDDFLNKPITPVKKKEAA